MCNVCDVRQEMAETKRTRHFKTCEATYFTASYILSAKGREDKRGIWSKIMGDGTSE